jgi:hypothetical protein
MNGQINNSFRHTSNQQSQSKLFRNMMKVLESIDNNH